MRLYEMMLKMGYPESLCRVVSGELSSEMTAARMMGYLSHYSQASEEQVVDEMLAILSDRDAWIRKKQMEENQQKWNRFLAEGFEDGEQHGHRREAHE